MQIGFLRLCFLKGSLRLCYLKGSLRLCYLKRKKPRRRSAAHVRFFPPFAAATRARRARVTVTHHACVFVFPARVTVTHHACVFVFPARVTVTHHACVFVFPACAFVFPALTSARQARALG